MFFNKSKRKEYYFFADVRNMVQIGLCTEKEIDVLIFTRIAELLQKSRTIVVEH
ncbi:MAG: hypothetical protein LBT50_01860 [Prevotellaceae bacterium]|jgi:hypothetical protein|nr:hypothetical protein [Prevotellaceae bacterium]